MSVVELAVEDGVAVVTLNRPERMNAWTLELERRYFDALEECARRTDVRAIVVTGAGRAFCAGADMEELEQIGAGDNPPRDPRSPLYALRVPKPVIAAINGACAGMGFVQAALCDLRFAAKGAKLTTAFSRRGLVAEHGLSWALPRLVGPGRALDLLFSARVVLAEEAAELGFVERLTEPGDALAEARAYALDLARNCSPASMADMKRQVYADLTREPEAALAIANELMARSLERPDFMEGVASFLEKRPPEFPPLPADRAP